MAGSVARVNVKGYRECIRALKRTDAETKKTLIGALKDAAEPVAADARNLIGHYRGASTATIQPRVVSSGVYVTQKARKKTGKHPYFGTLQMQTGLIPALDKHENDIVDGVDHAIGVLTAREGF